MMLKGRFAHNIALVLAASAFVAGVWLTFTLRDPDNADKPAIGGPFSLVDHHGQRVDEGDFRGRYLLVFFGYTYCPDICPTTLQTVSDALERIGRHADRVVPLFISVDPERDTPEAMKEYLSYFHPSIVGLTGNPAAVARAAKGYRVFYARQGDTGDGDYLMDHSAIVYLMGPDGAYVRHFSHGTSVEVLAERLYEIVR